MERARQGADGAGERRGHVRAGRGDHARGEGRGVHAVLGGRDPVGVDRLDVPGVGLAAPADQEALRDRGGLVDLRLRDRRPAHAACGLRHERERHHGHAREVVARLLVGDVDQLAEAPLRRELRERRLEVHARVAGAHRERMRLRRRQPRLVLPVHEQAPDLLVRDLARRAPRCPPRDSGAPRPPCRARRPSLERDDSLEPRRNLYQRHGRRILTSLGQAPRRERRH